MRRTTSFFLLVGSYLVILHGSRSEIVYNADQHEMAIDIKLPGNQPTKNLNNKITGDEVHSKPTGDEVNSKPTVQNVVLPDSSDQITSSFKTGALQRASRYTRRGPRRDALQMRRRSRVGGRIASAFRQSTGDSRLTRQRIVRQKSTPQVSILRDNRRNARRTRHDDSRINTNFRRSMDGSRFTRQHVIREVPRQIRSLRESRRDARRTKQTRSEERQRTADVRRQLLARHSEQRTREGRRVVKSLAMGQHRIMARTSRREISVRRIEQQVRRNRATFNTESRRRVARIDKRTIGDRRYNSLNRRHTRERTDVPSTILQNMLDIVTIAEQKERRMDRTSRRNRQSIGMRKHRTDLVTATTLHGVRSRGQKLQNRRLANADMNRSVNSITRITRKSSEHRTPSIQRMHRRYQRRSREENTVKLIRSKRSDLSRDTRRTRSERVAGDFIRTRRLRLINRTRKMSAPTSSERRMRRQVSDRSRSNRLSRLGHGVINARRHSRQSEVANRRSNARRETRNVRELGIRTQRSASNRRSAVRMSSERRATERTTSESSRRRNFRTSLTQKSVELLFMPSSNTIFIKVLEPIHGMHRRHTRATMRNRRSSRRSTNTTDRIIDGNHSESHLSRESNVRFSRRAANTRSSLRHSHRRERRASTRRSQPLLPGTFQGQTLNNMEPLSKTREEDLSWLSSSENRVVGTEKWSSDWKGTNNIQLALWKKDSRFDYMERELMNQMGEIDEDTTKTRTKFGITYKRSDEDGLWRTLLIGCVGILGTGLVKRKAAY